MVRIISSSPAACSAGRLAAAGLRAGDHATDERQSCRSSCLRVTILIRCPCPFSAFGSRWLPLATAALASSKFFVDRCCVVRGGLKPSYVARLRTRPEQTLTALAQGTVLSATVARTRSASGFVANWEREANDGHARDTDTTSGLPALAPADSLSCQDHPVP